MQLLNKFINAKSIKRPIVLRRDRATRRPTRPLPPLLTPEGAHAEEGGARAGRNKKEVVGVGDEHLAGIRVPMGFGKLNPGGSRRRFGRRRLRHSGGGRLKGGERGGGGAAEQAAQDNRLGRVGGGKSWRGSPAR